MVDAIITLGDIISYIRNTKDNLQICNEFIIIRHSESILLLVKCLGSEMGLVVLY